MRPLSIGLSNKKAQYLGKRIGKVKEHIDLLLQKSSLIRLIKYAIQDISDDDIEAVISALKSEFITQDETFRFWISFKKISAKFSIATNSAIAHFIYLVWH